MMLQQQISGVINLSLPLIIAYNLYPALLITLPGQIVCSLSLGFYLWYINYRQLKNLEKTLQFSPTERHKDYFYDLIRSCNVDPATVVLKYAYTNESIAMAAGKTIIIDPILWHDLGDDPQAVKVEEIFKVHIEPNITEAQKKRLASIHTYLNPVVQRFLFRHELGHILHHFSLKKLFVIFCIGTLATWTGILTMIILLPINAIVATLGGMIVGGVVDLSLSYASNLGFKLQEEKAADRFAVQYSSAEEIQAAADFFEQHQDILDKDTQNRWTFLPASMFTGYQKGKDRSVYLLQLMHKQ